MLDLFWATHNDSLRNSTYLTLVYETDPQALPLKRIVILFDALVRNVTIQAAACFNRIVSENCPSSSYYHFSSRPWNCLLFTLVKRAA